MFLYAIVYYMHKLNVRMHKYIILCKHVVVHALVYVYVPVLTQFSDIQERVFNNKSTTFILLTIKMI